MVWANESAQMIGATIAFSADGLHFILRAKVQCARYDDFWDVEYVGKCRTGAEACADDVCWGWTHCSCPAGCGGDCNQILQSECCYAWVCVPITSGY